MTDDTLTLTFHGAAQTVTGSCMAFERSGKSLLVDCGLF
jgi:metallo-beta-lactamase family protein